MTLKTNNVLDILNTNNKQQITVLFLFHQKCELHFLSPSPLIMQLQINQNVCIMTNLNVLEILKHTAKSFLI